MDSRLSPKISLVTCTKNSAPWLGDCLASAHRQTVAPFEHIIIDAGSTDETLSLIAKLAPKARIIRQTGTGLYNALNEGIRQATGDVIGFLHADDMFADDNCLERIAIAFEKNANLAFYCSRMKIYDEKLERPFAVLGAPPHWPSLVEELYSSNYFAHPTYYCSRQTVADVGMYNESYEIASDIDWLMRLEKRNLPFYFDPKILIKFRSHSGISARRYLAALKEEWLIRKKYDGATIRLFFVYGWHFLRRIVRFCLQTIGLEKAVSYARALIVKLTKADQPG